MMQERKYLMQKPLVSVIVPIYNAQNNIVRCVESIRRQTYENLEYCF